MTTTTTTIYLKPLLSTEKNQTRICKAGRETLLCRARRMASERSLQRLPEGSQADESGLHESSDPLTVTDWCVGIVVNECEVSDSTAMDPEVNLNLNTSE